MTFEEPEWPARWVNYLEWTFIPILCYMFESCLHRIFTLSGYALKVIVTVGFIAEV